MIAITKLPPFKPLNNTPKNSWGFTFVELMVSLALLALLASVVIPVSDLMSRQRKERELKQSLIELRQALDAYKVASDNGQIPDKYHTVSGYPPTLSALTGVSPTENPKQIQRFIRRIPRDPFADATIQRAEDTWGKRSFLSEANHPKAGEDIYDIYSLSAQIGSNGEAYSQW